MHEGDSEDGQGRGQDEVDGGKGCGTRVGSDLTKNLVIICANGTGKKTKDGKSSYISCLTAGSLIVRSINDKPLQTRRALLAVCCSCMK